jgi:flagella synthesis protein FlgN
MRTAVSIEQESQIINQLIEVLELEQSCLIKADFEQIQVLLGEKSALLQDLNQRSQERYQWLSAAGFPASESGMSDWLQTNAEHSLQSAWLTMQQSLLKAKELNRINGMLIGKHAARNQQLLSALQGRAETNQFYGPSGQATSNSRIRGSVIA